MLSRPLNSFFISFRLDFVTKTFVFCILFLTLCSMRTYARSHEEIRDDLLKDYQQKIAPKTETGQGIKIFIDLTLNYFAIEEAEQTFVANIWLNLEWNDTRLAWNDSDFKGSMHYGHDEVWHPDLTLYNSANPTEVVNYFGDTHLLANYTGKISWIPPSRVTSLCNLNLIKWPYDKQTCSLKFGSWTYSGAELDLNFYPSFIEHHDEHEEHYDGAYDFTDRFKSEDFAPYRNMEWDLTKITAQKTIKFYPGHPEPFVDIEFIFEVVRRSPSYTVSIVIPIIIISLVNMMLFLLPPSSGEKILIGCTNTFIVCLYLIYFESRLPNLGDHVPLIVLLYACNLYLMGVSLIISIIVINLSRTRRVSSPPQILRVFCNTNFATILGLGHIVPFVSKTHSRLHEETGVEMQSQSDLNNSTPNNQPHNFRANNFENSVHNHCGSSSTIIRDKDNDQLVNLVEPDHHQYHQQQDYNIYGGNAEWIMLASMIDRISFLVYAVIWGIIMALCL